MKKRFLSLLAALALCFALAGCTISTPDNVGTIGDTTLHAGMYLLCQYQAYTTAQGFAGADQDATDVSAFLHQTITVTDEDTGEDTDWLVSDYVADQTLKNLQYYAAVQARFAALGGTLTEEEIANADSTSQSIWDGNAALYEKNGFNLETIKSYEYALAMADDLLTLVYGSDGETPVSDDALTAHIESEMPYGYYVSVPLYNTSTYALDSDASTAAVAACQAAADEFNEAAATSDFADADALEQLFLSALDAHLADAYAAVGNTFDQSAASVSADFFTASVLDSYYSDESAAAIRDCAVGEAVVVNPSDYACEVVLRINALDVNSLDDIRAVALQDLMGGELEDSLYAYGADTLPNALDANAMRKLPASRIVLSVS